jgi:electron transfer flavoprotein alpha subunit
MSQGLPESYAPLVIENAKKGGYSHILVGHTAFGKTVMPRVAAILDTQQISDVMGIENENSECRVIKTLFYVLMSPSIRTTNLCRERYPHRPVVG